MAGTANRLTTAERQTRIQVRIPSAGSFTPLIRSSETATGQLANAVLQPCGIPFSSLVAKEMRDVGVPAGVAVLNRLEANLLLGRV